MSETTHEVTIDPLTKRAKSCIDLCYSPDDGGWYAQEYDFQRKDHATRTSAKIYSSRRSLEAALSSGKHRWHKWD